LGRESASVVVLVFLLAAVFASLVVDADVVGPVGVHAAVVAVAEGTGADGLLAGSRGLQHAGAALESRRTMVVFGIGAGRVRVVAALLVVVLLGILIVVVILLWILFLGVVLLWIVVLVVILLRILFLGVVLLRIVVLIVILLWILFLGVVLLWIVVLVVILLRILFLGVFLLFVVAISLDQSLSRCYHSWLLSENQVKRILDESLDAEGESCRDEQE